MKFLISRPAVVALVSALLSAPLATTFARAPLSGRVIGFGENISGQATGTPSPAASHLSAGVVTVEGQALTNVLSIAAGLHHGLALCGDSRVVRCGAEEGGWYKLGATPPRATNGLVRIGGQVLSNVVAVAAGDAHDLALKSDGTVVGWGTVLGMKSPQDAAAVPAGLSNVVAISAGWDHDLALKADGTVVSWNRTIPLAGLSNVVAISAGKGDSPNNLALQKDGTVVEWTSMGAPVEVPAQASPAAAISAGTGHYLVLKNDGTVFGWGENANGQATGVPSTNYSSGFVTVGGQVLSNVVTIAAGDHYSYATKRDGTLVVWGSNPLNLISLKHEMKDVLAVAPGENFCLVLVSNGAASNGQR